MKSTLSPGWYAVATADRVLLNRLSDVNFRIFYAPLYAYVSVRRENLQLFREMFGGRRPLRVPDVDVERVINHAIARAAVGNYPGSRREGSFTDHDILRLLREQKNICVACGTNISGRYTIDHIVPSSRGGSNDPANIQLLCKSCNSSKHDRSMDEWLTSTGRQPAVAPRPGASTVDARFHRIASRLAGFVIESRSDALYGSEGSIQVNEKTALEFEIWCMAQGHFFPPRRFLDIILWPTVLFGQVTDGELYLRWRIFYAPTEVPKLWWMTPIGDPTVMCQNVEVLPTTHPSVRSFVGFLKLSDEPYDDRIWRLTAPADPCLPPPPGWQWNPDFLATELTAITTSPRAALMPTFLPV